MRGSAFCPDETEIQKSKLGEEEKTNSLDSANADGSCTRPLFDLSLLPPADFLWVF